MEAVCFDMDGVIVDSEDYWEPYQAADLFPRLDLAGFDSEEITGMNYREIYDYLVAEHGIEMDREPFLAWFEDAAAAIYGDDVTVLPNLEATVADLRERGVAVALVSSSPRDWIDRVRDRADIAFDAVVSADAIDGPGKPEPAVYERAAAELGLDTGDIVAVEDSVHGIESAQRAGVRAIGFRHGASDDTDRTDADAVVDSPAELRAHLLELAEEG